ncbi:TonB-linked outer membrane protein, SusC/RagA family [Elysia marginata]|uniref:TonB-linked outer membrane protein, SusC/RagA family n=1 Tax=Elysia marginata TaxID=1093978 RepID=A0AAV4G5W7_9GAST|nr:TonB-linked outer membrane protein, SusC/RagA family [Elysia marginata]
MKPLLYPLKFHPIFKQRIWGGSKLKDLLGKDVHGETIGESWELSGIEGDISIVKNGALSGKNLNEIIEDYPAELLGELSKKGNYKFPILVKFIDAKKDLSVQVHPNDSLAKQRHQSFGKTEMWHILQAEPKANLIVGFREDVSKECYKEKLQAEQLSDILQYENVKKGDTFFIESGLIHAIGGGVLLAEIQQTSDITYRVYDFNRTDKDGNKRELHIDLALDTLIYKKTNDYKVKYKEVACKSNEMVNCPFFKTNYLPLNQDKKLNIKDRKCFSIYLCTEGSGTIENDFGKEQFHIGETLLREVSGVVKSKSDELIPGVTVLIKGKNKGVQTDINGAFSILVNSGDILQFKYLGMESQELAIKDDMTFLTIVMKERSEALEGVVLTGYRKLEATEFAGSAVTIKADKVRIGGVSTVDKMLQGQVAGVQVTTASSNFGVAPKIRIRGSSSISGINSPLWVLDGVVLQRPINVNPSQISSGTARALLSSVLGGINPDDIDNITVLKDATATALYGTKAVNGVIVINTKRGKKNQPLKVAYNSLFTYNIKPSIKKFNVANSQVETDVHQQLYEIYQAGLLNYSAANQGALTKLIDQRNRKELTRAQYLDELRRIKSENTDWFAHLFNNNITQQHSVSVLFGGEKTAGRASLSFYTDPGFSLVQNVRRYTLNLSNKFNFSEKFSVELLLKYADRLQRNPGTSVNPYNYASKTSRAMRPYDDKGNLEYYKKWYVDFNIVNEMANDFIDVEAKDLNAQVQIDYKPFDKLKLKLLANRTTVVSSITSSKTENSAFANSYRTEEFKFIEQNNKLYRDPSKPSNSLPETTMPYGGVLKSTNSRTISNTLRFQGDYTVLDNDTHELNIFAGTEIIKSTSNEVFLDGIGYIFASGTPFTKELAMTKLLTGGNKYYNTSVFRRNQVSFYGSLTYNFIKKYNLTMSLRNDATNISGESSRNRFLPTYTVAAAWLVDKEGFFNQEAISNLKLRASFGLRGNAGNRGPDVVAIHQNLNRIYKGFDVLAIHILEPEVSDLEFEKEYIVNLGVDVSFLKYFSLTANYYHRKNFDLIGSKEVPLSTGYDVKTMNWATMTNQGYEASLRINPITLFKDFSIATTFNIGFNKNKVVSNYIGSNPTIFYATNIGGYAFQGRPLTGLYSFKFSGLDSNGLAQYFDAKGNKVYGFTGDNKDYGNIEYQGSRDPLYSGGFSFTFNYKKLSLTTFFSYVAGNVIRKPHLYKGNMASDLSNLSQDFQDRWQSFGNEKYTNIPRLLDAQDRTFFQSKGIFSGSQYECYNKSDIRTVNASYMRLRNVSLKYDIPQKAVNFLKLDYISAQLQGTNLLLFASEKLRGQDPEILIQGTNIPPITSFTLGLNVGF